MILGCSYFRLALVALCGCVAAHADPRADFFETRIRPIFAEQCYNCHGPENQKSGLRADHISFLMKGGETGPALMAGDPAASRLFTAVSYSDVDLQMPPKGKLSDAQIADIQQWILDGAYWPEETVPEAGAAPEPAFDVMARAREHWAWQPIRTTAPPEVRNAAWPLNGIDHFIAARLEREDLQPAPPADRRTIMRRLSFDLTGLPPDPAAVEAFVADSRPDAYERVVDAMLASQHFGERWGRHWLDITRYAETYGHEQDFAIGQAWRYRDYVIRALNADVPYDQLLREHIAGDLLPTPRRNPQTGTNESIEATAFWHMHQATHAPVDVRQDQADRIDNQIDVFSKAFLGMTVSCARCHDHKLDAISAKDYYALSGIFHSSRQQFAYLDPHGKIAEGVAKLKAENADIDSALAEVSADSLAAPVFSFMLAALEATKENDTAATAKRQGLDPPWLDRWTATLRDGSLSAPTHPLHLFAKYATSPDADLSIQDRPNQAQQKTFESFDDAAAFTHWSATGHAFGEGPSGAGAWMEEAGRIRYVAKGVAHSGLLDTRLEGTLRSPDFIIESDSIQYRVAGKDCTIRLVIDGYQLRTFTPLLFESTMIDVKHGDAFQWVEQRKDVGKYKGRTAYVEVVDPGDGWIAIDEIRFADAPLEPHPDYSLQHALLSPTPPASAFDLATRYMNVTRQALLDWRNGCSQPAQLDLLNFLSANKLIAPLETQCADRVEQKKSIAQSIPRHERALAMIEGTPTDTPLLVRGNYKTPGDTVQRRFLEAIAGSDPMNIPAGSGRMQLADQVLAPNNPLPARVMVNRLWHHLMGRGIVASVDNFGVLGQAPSHPELLDYLATEFVAKGWSIKNMIREIVTSQTYRMSSNPTDAIAEDRDPDNILLHRMNRRRLEGEAVRDAILAVAGTLDDTPFGPSIPAYISPFVEGNRRPKESGPADGARRRSIYMEVRRNYLPPMLQAFDMPVPDTTQGRRNVSNVPAQALILMNDPFVTDQAAAWAKTIAATGCSIDDGLDKLYLAAFSRLPEAGERAQMTAFLESQAALYGADATQNDPRVWADLCHVLFTLKEFIFIG